MSVSLAYVLEQAGYDLSTVEDAKWLVSKVVEFEQLVVEAEDLIDSGEEE